MPRVADDYLEQRRRQIMDAAVACFSREGFHRTTMQDIVRETGLSAGAIYRYFKAKEDIVAAIAAERHEPEAAALATGSLTDIVRASLGRLADPDEQRWRRITVQVWAEGLRDDRIKAIVHDGLDQPMAILAELIRQGQDDGRFPPDVDPAATARVFASIFQGLVLQQAFEPDLDVDAYIDAVLGLLGVLTRRRRASAGRSRP